MTTAVIVQARWSSKRLPGKILEPLGGGTVLSEALRRLAAMRRADEVVVAVPDDPSSDPIIAAARALGYHTISGSETDVLDRFLTVARAVDASVIVRVTSDCPMTDPQLCDAVVDLRVRTGADYACNNRPRSFPHGLDCECFTRDTLERAAAEATGADDREHVTPWMRRSASTTRASLEGPADRVNERWTVDFPEDLAFMRAAWPLLENGDVTAWADALRLLDSAPHIADINRLRRVERRAIPGPVP